MTSQVPWPGFLRLKSIDVASESCNQDASLAVSVKTVTSAFIENKNL